MDGEKKPALFSLLHPHSTFCVVLCFDDNTYMLNSRMCYIYEVFHKCDLCRMSYLAWRPGLVVCSARVEAVKRGLAVIVL